MTIVALPVDKWAIGEPMIEWCERNGLDATRIPATEDAIVTAMYQGQLWAVIKFVITDDELPWTPGPDVIEKWSDGDGFSGYTRSVQVDSEPPKTAQWVALFGDQ